MAVLQQKLIVSAALLDQPGHFDLVASSGPGPGLVGPRATRAGGENLADLGGPLGSDRYWGGEAGPGQGPCSGSPRAAAWGSRGLSLAKFYRVRRPRWGARCRGDESKPCPGGAPSFLRESVCEQAMTAAWKRVVGT